MPVGGTTIGPLAPETRDRLAEYRDANGLPNYDAAVRDLLEVEGRD